MSRRRKRIKKLNEDEDIFEKLEAQNRALQKIIKKLKTGNDKQNPDNKKQ